MSKTVDFPNKNLSKEQVSDILSSLGEFTNSKDLGETIGKLFLLPEDKFALISTGILSSFLQSLNNANTSLTLVQAINARGTTVEDVLVGLKELIKSIDSLQDFSVQKKDFLKQIASGIANCISETEGVARKYLQIPFEKCRKSARMPEYAHIGDSGMDLFALEDYTIHPGETKLIPTGLKFVIPNGYEFQIRPKSGRALKTKIRIPNSPSTVDAGYRGELCVIVENIEPPIKDITYEFDENGRPVITSILHGSDYHIGKGEKFAQLVLAEVPKATFYQIEKVSEETDRGAGGFGSSGLK